MSSRPGRNGDRTDWLRFGAALALLALGGIWALTAAIPSARASMKAPAIPATVGMGQHLE